MRTFYPELLYKCLSTVHIYLDTFWIVLALEAVLLTLMIMAWTKYWFVNNLARLTSVGLSARLATREEPLINQY